MRTITLLLALFISRVWRGARAHALLLGSLCWEQSVPLGLAAPAPLLSLLSWFTGQRATYSCLFSPQLWPKPSRSWSISLRVYTTLITHLGFPWHSFCHYNTGLGMAMVMPGSSFSQQSLDQTFLFDNIYFRKKSCWKDLGGIISNVYFFVGNTFFLFEIIIEKCVFATFHTLATLFGIIQWRPLPITDLGILIKCIDLNKKEQEICPVALSKFLWYLTIS